jgi:hypothetical protein
MTTADPVAAPATPPRLCENCGTPLLGEHCYVCGQPTKGMVRHFSSIIGDFFDTVLNIDARVLRTLWPLLVKPGFLSCEYFAGRRVRYVTPVRLYLFLSVVMFFAIQGSINVDDDGNSSGLHINSSDDIFDAKTPADVEKAVAAAHEELAEARKNAAGTPGAAGVAIADKKIDERGREQIAYLKAVDEAKGKGEPTPARPIRHSNSLEFPINGKNWDPDSNPIVFGWLPAPLNRLLNHRLAHARDVLRQSNSEKPLLDGLFNVLPQTLFLLLPLFALMLKVAYWFKRRLFMEHLIVALHSHSFIALSLILAISLSWLQQWLTPNGGPVNGVLGLGIGLMSLWIPVYLLLMQKRVYGQGWPMTLIKYSVLGVSYLVLLGIGLAGAMLVGLLTL